MRQHDYTTQNGSQINIQIVTEEPNLADHNFTSSCYRLEVHVNGERQTPQRLQAHNDYPHGLLACMPNGNRRAYVPLDETARAIWDEYRAETNRRLDERLGAEESYQQHRERMHRAMNQ